MTRRMRKCPACENAASFHVTWPPHPPLQELEVKDAVLVQTFMRDCRGLEMLLVVISRDFRHIATG
jgi:hypothetical protein